MHEAALQSPGGFFSSPAILRSNPCQSRIFPVAKAGDKSMDKACLVVA